MYRLIYVVERLDGSEHRVPYGVKGTIISDLDHAKKIAQFLKDSERVKTANVIRIDIEEV